MCTKSKKSNNRVNHNSADTDRTRIDFALIEILSNMNVSNPQISRLFPSLREFSDNISKIELAECQLDVIQRHYRTERKIARVDLSKVSEIPMLQIAPETTNVSNIGNVYIRFFKKNDNTILGAVYSALPFCGPMYVEEFCTFEMVSPRMVYADSSLRDNMIFLDGIRNELRGYCVSALSFVEYYPNFSMKKKNGEHYITEIKEFTYIKGYTRKKRHVCGYFKGKS